MPYDFEGKIAVVTGGAKGIGRAISIELAACGATVYALGRSFGSDEFAEEANAASKIRTIVCDVGDFSSVNEAIGSIHKEAGRIDFLVNNAGITKDNLLLRMTEQEWDDVLNINLKGAFNTCKAVSKIMISQRAGRIVNIGSIVGTTGNAGQMNYSAAKAGLAGLTKSLAKELASRNILVNLVAPGYVKTAMTDKLTEDQVASFKDNIPLKRVAMPEEIATAVSFFLSEGSSYITGQVVHVDGGLAM